MTETVTVGVLGAAGTIAPAIVHDLAVSEEVERMLLLDLDGSRAATVADQYGGGKAESRTADAREEAVLARGLDEVTLSPIVLRRLEPA